MTTEENLTYETQLSDLRINAEYIKTLDITQVSNDFLQQMIDMLDSLGETIIHSRETAKYADEITKIVIPEIQRRKTVLRERRIIKNHKDRGPGW